MMTVMTDICNAFERQSAHYEKAAVIQNEIGTRLFERLDYLKMTPKRILDLGCGPGIFSQKLKQRYATAEVVSLDIAYGMLHQARHRSDWKDTALLVNGTMTALPFVTGAFDLVFANQVIHWSPSLSLLFQELSRVMSYEGCLLFSTLGPDTFLELRQAFETLDTYAHINEFMDLHDLGDALLAAQFLDPVVDREDLTAQYATLSHLLRSLKMQGVRHIHPKRRSGLMGKTIWRQFEEAMLAYRTETGKCPLTYEVVYGQAWKGQMHQTGGGAEIMVPIDEMMKTYRH